MSCQIIRCERVSRVPAGFKFRKAPPRHHWPRLSEPRGGGCGLSTSTLDLQGPLGWHNVATTTRVEPSSLDFKVAQLAASGTDIGQIPSCACG